MNTALVGSHGTGKSVVYKRLHQEFPKAAFFTEGVRYQLPEFGFKDAYEVINKYGVGAFEIFNINSWSVIDPNVNTKLSKNSQIITDRSAVDNYAYFLTLASKTDEKFKPLVKRMAQYYASLVDRFIYFPVDVIPLVADSMRLDDQKYQKDVDENIHLAFRELGIVPAKIYQLRSITIDDRVSEITKLIK